MAIEGDDYRYGLRSRGRPSSINVPSEEEAVTRQRQPRSAERQVDIVPIGMIHLVDTAPPYDAATYDIHNLEPHRGGYRPRYGDEIVVSETDDRRKPFGLIPVAGHLFYPVRFFLKGLGTDPSSTETRPLEWLQYTTRANVVYIMLDDNSMLTVRYLGTWIGSAIEGGDLKVYLKSDVSDIFYEEGGGWLQWQRNLYLYDSLELLPDGRIKIHGFRSIDVSDYPNNTSIMFNVGDPVFWVSRSSVERAPTIVSGSFFTDSSSLTDVARFPLFSPIVVADGSLLFGSYLPNPGASLPSVLPLIATSQDDPLPYLLYQGGQPPRQSEVNYRRDAGNVWSGRGLSVYQQPNSGCGWVGVSVGDIFYPKFERTTGTGSPYSVLPTSSNVPNERFEDASLGVPNWFRPHYRKDGVGGESSCWYRYGENTTDIQNLINGMESSYNNLYWNGQTTADWHMRFLRYPPRTRHVLGQAFIDNKEDTPNSSYVEMSLLPPYRSKTFGMYDGNPFDLKIGNQRVTFGLSPVADVYTSDGLPWTILTTDGSPLPQGGTSGQNYFLPPSGLLSYGFRVLKTSSERQVVVSSRMICGDQPRIARLVFRNIRPSAFSNDLYVKVANDRSNLSSTVNSVGKSHYNSYVKQKLVHRDKTPLGDHTDPKFESVPLNDPNWYKNYEPLEFYYKVPIGDVGLYDISGIDSSYRVLTIPRLVIYNAGSTVPQETVFFYGILGELSGGYAYVPVVPKESELKLFEIIDIGRVTTQQVVSPEHNYMVTNLILENVAIKVPKNDSPTVPYVGLEIRVLTPGRAREQANGAPRQTVPVIDSKHVVGADGLDEPIYTNVELWANTYRPDGSTKKCWEFFLMTEPPKERVQFDYQFSAVILSGDTWGKRSDWFGVSGVGNKLRFSISVPPVDLDKKVAHLVIMRQTGQGPVVVYKKRLNNSDLNTTVTVDIPADLLGRPGFVGYYSQTEPKYGFIESDNLRIIVSGPTSAFLSHVGDGLSWKIRPDSELDGVTVALPYANMYLTKYNGKPFFVSGSKTYVLVNESAYNVAFLPTSTSVTLVTQYDTNNEKIYSNMIDGLLHVGEDGVYLGEQKQIAFTERLPDKIRRIYVVDLTFSPLVVVEKTDSIDLYWSDTQTPGYIRWSIPRTSYDRWINQVVYVNGYIHLVVPNGLGEENPNAQVLRVGSSSVPVPTSSVGYWTNPLRSPVGLRVRKMRAIFVDPTTHSDTSPKVRVRFYRRPFHDPNWSTSLITEHTFSNHKTVPVRHRDMKLESLNMRVEWLDPTAVLHHLELITYPGVIW